LKSEKENLFRVKNTSKTYDAEILKTNDKFNILSKNLKELIKEYGLLETENNLLKTKQEELNNQLVILNQEIEKDKSTPPEDKIKPKENQANIQQDIEHKNTTLANKIDEISIIKQEKKRIY